ncbi:MAG: bifunctional sugar phosphate isomerase/epimerase/4-hydroxyphenylpyruvate dioxygenase family protein [Solirubrobacteraceae bacterium]
MRRAIATVCLSGTIEEKLRAAAAAGFDAIELFEPDFLGTRLHPRELRRYAADLGLAIDLYQPFRDLEGVSGERLARNLERAERKFELMEALGVELMLVCSNVSPAAIDDDELAAAQLHELAERAARRGLRVAYEALAWGTNVHDYRHAWSIVERAGHPALGTCLDSFHIFARGSDLDGLAQIDGEKIFFLQLADAPYLQLDVLQWSRHYRCFPGQGSFDVAGLVQRVLRAGYRGPLSLEVFNDVFRQSEPERTALDAMRSLLLLEDQLAASAAGAAARQLPASSRLTGYAFAELAVDFRDAPQLDRLLSAAGFARTGEHRSKPVELWEQDAVRLVVNRGAQHDEPAAIVATALESDDPLQSLARAEALLARRITLDHQPSETDISTVAAPDGTQIFFCNTSTSDPRSWLGDFTARAESLPPGLGLLRIDHVALSQRLDSFDEAALFYRSVLGLAARDREEVASPDGLIRSRAFTGEHSALRFVLNSPVIGRAGMAPHLRRDQHIAFACADLLALARAFVDRDVPVVQISDNYYDDLAARLDLDEQLLAEIRELSVLYDSDGHGEFLHLYVDIPGARAFLEFVQRRSGYDGYGAVNSPVRMAAQAAPALVGGAV